MAKRGRRSSLPVDKNKIMGAMGTRLAEENGVEMSAIRHAEYWIHNGVNWTLVSGWEIDRGQGWEPLDCPGDQFTTPLNVHE